MDSPIEGMTREEYEAEIEQIEDWFGDVLPNPHQYPRCFNHYVKLYKHIVNIKKQRDTKAEEIHDFTGV